MKSAAPSNPHAYTLALARLRTQQTLLVIKILVLALLGLPVTLIGPAVIALLFWISLFLLGWGLSYSLLFLVFCLIMIPAMFHMEVRTGGNYFTESLSASTLDEPPAPAPGPELLAGVPIIAAITGLPLEVPAEPHPRAALSGIVEIFLTGPRYLLTAYHDLRTSQSLRGVSRERAAEVLSR